MQPFDLTSDRLHLSAPAASDAPRITELCQDPDVREWTTVPSPYEHAHAEAFIHDQRRWWADGTALTWAIRNHADHRAEGMIGVSCTGDGKGEIGFWLGPDARGAGLAAHAVRLVARRVFAADIGVTHLVWWAYVGNWASRRVAWATGFRHEGRVRGGAPQRGRRRDAWIATLCPGDPLAPATPWLDVPTIRSTRVRLRAFADADADTITEACADTEAQRWLASLPRPYTRDDALAYIHACPEEAASGREIRWAATAPDGGPALGSFSLRITGPRRDQGVIGYVVHPAARGKGLATAATRLIVRHAFIPASDGGLGLRRLAIEHADGNEGSRKVIERCGFRHIGVERAALELPDGTWVDHHRYDLLADEFTDTPLE